MTGGFAITDYPDLPNGDVNTKGFLLSNFFNLVAKNDSQFQAIDNAIVKKGINIFDVTELDGKAFMQSYELLGKVADQIPKDRTDLDNDWLAIKQLYQKDKRFKN